MISTSVAARIAAVDVGGTFTDVAVWDAASNCLQTVKLLNDARRPAAAIGEGLKACASDVARVIHGTTLVTNALIERRGASVGLITTEGFRDVLEIADELRYDTFDLRLRRAEPLVDRPRRVTVRERMAADGTVVQPVDLEEVLDAGRRLLAEGADVLVVAFVNAHANSANERRAVDALAGLDEEVEVVAATDVCAEIGEYGRFSTAVANAYTRPLLSSYLDDVCATVDAPVFLILSDGNIVDANTAAAAPVRLVESGPAAGTVAVARLAEERGWPHVLAFDMGGTTAKISLIHDGVPQLANGIEIARIQRLKKGSGIPLRLPSVDLLEIGAGGGSIAARDAMGLLKVGPESAGAAPGPACYGVGGERPTVTDADLCLGYISADGLVGGRLPLRLENAERALDALGAELGFDRVATAAGIVEVVNTFMASAARVHLAEHGRDPRRYRMVAFGGAGPVHACGVAEILGVPEVVFPEDAGIASAIGMLVARPGVEVVRPHIVRLSRMSWDAAEALVAELEAAAVAQLSEFATTGEDLSVSLTLEMRYAGQGHEIAVPAERTWIRRRDDAAVMAAFEREYVRRFGRSLESVPVEIVAWRLRASTAAAVATTGVDRREARDDSRPHMGERSVFFRATERFESCRVLQRGELSPQTIAGPCLIEDSNTTIIVPPGWSVSRTAESGDVLAQRTGA